MTREVLLTKQIVVRVDGPLYEALKVDAKENGRTIAQTVRFHLEGVLWVVRPDHEDDGQPYEQPTLGLP